MIDVLISGINGAMGNTLLNACKTVDEIKVVVGVDIDTKSSHDFPVYSSFNDVKEHVDVVIDFSNSAALESILEYCTKNSIAAVLCTTGHSSEQEQKIKECSTSIPIFRSANMSLGVNLVANLAKSAAKFLDSDFDIEIVEKHHHRKVDAPSGTAMMLANEINSAMDNKFNYVYERESVRKSRDKNEIGIHSIRGGTIVGEHEVIFAGTDEVITITHSISSRSVFAVGAIKAALFMPKQPPGLYNMNSIIN